MRTPTPLPPINPFLIQLPEKYKQHFNVPSEDPSSGSSIYIFSGSCLSHITAVCYRRLPTLAQIVPIFTMNHCSSVFIIYSKCQSSSSLFADWTKLYHVPVHKTSCSLHALARGQPVNNKTGSEARAARAS